jgi:hypothetical protein
MNYSLKIILIISAILSFTASCGNGQDEKYEVFLQTYKDILIARESTADSALANQKVDSILNAKGLSEAKFRQIMIDLSQDKDDFFKMIDSVRSSLKAISRPRPKTNKMKKDSSNQK